MMSTPVRRGLVAAVAAGTLGLAGLAVPASATAAPVTELPRCFDQLRATSFTASPSSVPAGGPATLSWAVSRPPAPNDCSRVSLLLSPGSAVAPTGSTVVRPVASTTYRLMARSAFFDPELRRPVVATRTLATRAVTVTGGMPVTVQLSSFRVANADEDSFFSNGDEPYLFVMPVFFDGTTIDVGNLAGSSVRVSSAASAHDNLTSGHMKAGSAVAVPAATGRFATTIHPVRGVPESLGKSLANVGLVVVALEEDATPDGAANAGRIAARNELKAQLDALVRTMTLPTPATIEAIKGAVKAKVRAAVKRETLARFGLFGFIDPDDYIDAEVVQASFADIEAAGAAGVPVSMTLDKSGVDYRVTGVIRRG